MLLCCVLCVALALFCASFGFLMSDDDDCFTSNFQIYSDAALHSLQYPSSHLLYSPKTMLNTAAGASWGDVDCCVIE